MILEFTIVQCLGWLYINQGIILVGCC